MIYSAVFTIIATITSFSMNTDKVESLQSSGWIYVGTYTQKESHVNGKAEGIYI